MIRLLVGILVIIPATAFYGLRMIWAVYRNSPNALCICNDCPRKWSRLLLKVTGIPVSFENVEVLDPDRPQVLVANHTSWYDVLVLCALIPGRYLFVAKKELAGVPLFGRAIRTCGHIFIDRGDRSAAVESMEEARQNLEDQSPTIIMFPEGTRSPTGELQPFKKGAFVLAIQTGAEIVPAAISGSHEVMPKGSLRIRKGAITVRLGEPISVAEYEHQHRNELTQKSWQALAELQASR